MTGRVLKAMPERSKAVVYGVLSNQACSEIRPYDLIFQDKRIEGFWLTPWLLRKGMLSRMRLTSRAQRLIAGGVFDSKVRARLPFDEIRSGLRDYHRRMSEGKILICPAAG
jgi:NADPH2:quinone reductase